MSSDVTQASRTVGETASSILGTRQTSEHTKRRLLAHPRPSSITSIRTLLSGFVVLLSILLDSVLLRVVFVGLLSDLTGSF